MMAIAVHFKVVVVGRLNTQKTMQKLSDRIKQNEQLVTCPGERSFEKVLQHELWMCKTPSICCNNSNTDLIMWTVLHQPSLAKF